MVLKKREIKGFFFCKIGWVSSSSLITPWGIRMSIGSQGLYLQLALLVCILFDSCEPPGNYWGRRNSFGWSALSLFVIYGPWFTSARRIVLRIVLNWVRGSFKLYSSSDFCFFVFFCFFLFCFFFSSFFYVHFWFFFINSEFYCLHKF